MKKTLLIYLLSFIGLAINAQVIGLPETQIEANFQDVDLTTNWVELNTLFTVTNLTSDSIQVKWTREISPECNQEWESAIADNNLGYIPSVDTNWGVNTNGSEVYSASELGPNESYESFKLSVYPRMNVGCCDIKINFSLIEDPDSILATATLAVNVNMNDDCSAITTFSQDIEVAKSITAFPSPTADFFQLTENEVVRQIVIYNSVGQLIKTMNYTNGTSYDLTNESDGLYFLQLKNEEGENLKLLSLVKGSK